jgi:hypothetical protein
MNDMVSRSALIDNAHFLVRCLRYRFRTEKLQIRTMMRLQLRGATVLDIGANKGIYCFWMMRAVGPSGCVIAFEPQPEMRDSIERQKLRFDWRNLRVMNVALSNSEGSMNLSRQKSRRRKRIARGGAPPQHGCDARRSGHEARHHGRGDIPEPEIHQMRCRRP